ncbi:MAG: hypothetical protein DHS20C18_00200 [Saprospiraceae bacterium]|nr:MAG: hypothetical protein DHS20C18_00200 [Saprospiraceae bacterium]
MKKDFLLCLLALLLITDLYGQSSYTPETVPDPKQGGNGYVSDPANYLSSGEMQQLNQIISELERNSTAQVAVAILPSIGQEVPKDFATRLFAHWGIGQKENDNGLLLLVVMDQRRTEFETGYGLEGVLPDIICYRILIEELVPQFQAGNYGAGVVAAISRVKTLLENPEILEEIRAESEPKYYHFFGLKIPPLIYWYAVIALLFCLGVVVWMAVTLANKEELYDKYRHIRYVYSIVFLVLFPIPYLLVFFGLKMVLKRLRNQPRFSKLNGAPMRKLTEQEEDDFLEKGQIAEELLGTIDYDVWVSDDMEDVVILPYKKRFSQYSSCPKCHFRTYHHTHTRTLRHATSHNSGQKERLYECKNCNYVKRDLVIIPRITSSSGSGGGGGGGGWGGGSSGGGGGGASW